MESEKLILNRLDAIKTEVSFIRENLLDILITSDDLNSLDEAEKDLKEGKTTSHEKLKKEMGL